MLLKRVFDIEQCLYCGGILKIVVVIKDPVEIAVFALFDANDPSFAVDAADLEATGGLQQPGDLLGAQDLRKRVKFATART